LTKYALQFNFGLRKNRFEFAYSMKPTFFNISDLEGELTYDGVARQFDVDRTRINTYLSAGFILNINEFSAK